MNHKQALDALVAVLCDPAKKCCLAGSDEDRRIVDIAIAALGDDRQEDARCAECDARLEDVRPGKHQHPTCSQHPPAQALVVLSDGWLPIESAPKDGSEVLVWAPAFAPLPVMMRYCDRGYFAKECGDPDYNKPGWYLIEVYDRDFLDMSYKVIYWHPIFSPNKPKDAET